MAEINTATGWKLYIGTTLAADDQTEYVADSYTEVGLVETLGSFGDQASGVTFSSLGDGRVRKAKGARDAGTMSITCAHEPTDAGQAAMIAAQRTSDAYNIKVEANDSAGTDSVFFFRAFVRSARLNVGGNDNVVRREFELDIDTEVTEILATT
jgi:hypothetical protein